MPQPDKSSSQRDKDVSSVQSRNGSGLRSCGHDSYSSESTDSMYGDLPAAFSGRSSRNYEKMTRKDYEELEKVVFEYFDKKFYFRPPLEKWTLPEPCKMFVADRWKVSEHKV